METYLSPSSQPNLDISSHFVKSPSRRFHYHTNGTDTPKELSSRLKILELFTLHVLPRNEEWDYARSFISNSDILDDERREAFLQTLQELQDARDLDDRDEEMKFLRMREEEQEKQRKEEVTRKEKEAAVLEGQTLQQNGSTHRRTSSEVDYGIEKSHPNGIQPTTGDGSKTQKFSPSKPRLPPSVPVGRTQFSPPAETSKHRPVRKSTQSQSNDLFKQARHLIRALQYLARNMAGAITRNPTALFRAMLFVLAVLMAFSRREIRERARRIVGNGWEKTRQTFGMGVKISYI